MGNRAQRRLAGREDRLRDRDDRRYIDQEIRKQLEAAREEISEESSHFYMGIMYTIFIIVLRRQFQFGQTRINRALDQVAAITNAIDEGRSSVYDLQAMAEEAGFRVVFDCDRNIIRCNAFEERRNRTGTGQEGRERNGSRKDG